jgi:N utilization substance protein B
MVEQLTNKEQIACNKAAARLIAVQTIYSFDLNETSENWEAAFTSILSIYDGQSEGQLTPDSKLLARIVENVATNLAELDEIITRFLVNDWNMGKLGACMRSILRAGLAEIKYMGDIPPKVIINEYTTLTKQFYSDSEIGFVNAILEKMAKEIR